jgi:hypothetical protein
LKGWESERGGSERRVRVWEGGRWEEEGTGECEVRERGSGADARPSFPVQYSANLL